MLTFPNCDACVEDANYPDLNTEPTVELNVPLLMRTLLAVHTWPERWDQSTFFDETSCGTTMCFAGWTLVLEGFGEDYDGSYAFKAQELLGLTDDEREHVFFHLQTHDLIELTETTRTLLTHRGLLPVNANANAKELTDARTSV